VFSASAAAILKSASWRSEPCSLPALRVSLTACSSVPVVMSPRASVSVVSTGSVGVSISFELATGAAGNDFGVSLSAIHR
jgi:hypothetical protein